MTGHHGPKVLVLYKIINVKGEGNSFNAFELPFGGEISLAYVKKNCRALLSLNTLGTGGYHWRVRVDEKVSNPKAPPKYSWWDIQDESAKLPLKNVTFLELSHMLSTPRRSTPDDSAVSSVTRSLGKAMTKVAASVNESSNSYDHGCRVPVVVFKLVDIVKLFDTHKTCENTDSHRIRESNSRQTYRERAPRQYRSIPSATESRQSIGDTSSLPKNRRTPSTVKEGPLMDFEDAAAPHGFPRPSSKVVAQDIPNESRAQKLKREYELKNKTENRVWDEVDQRWVAVGNKGLSVSRATTSAPPGENTSDKEPKLKGVSLDKVDTSRKSTSVASAVQNRVNEMKSSQQKALNEIRQREAAKKKSEDEEDVVRLRLEPQIKAWSEEHGNKKQLRALLASLHTILWPGAKWKPVNLGDLLDDRKVKLAFHKASRVVHPDKTMRLGPEERFLAKRIFDALSQAKTVFDNSL